MFSLRREDSDQGFESGSALLESLDLDPDPHSKCGSGSMYFEVLIQLKNSIFKYKKPIFTF